MTPRLTTIVTFSFLLVIGLASCKSGTRYSISDKYLSKPSDCNCDIFYRYPEISVKDKSDTNLINLNNVLKSAGDLEMFIERCDPKSPTFMKTFKRYTCDFKVNLQTDSILSIEILNTAYYNDSFSYTRFNSFLVNPINWTEIRLETLFHGLDRGKIYPYVEDYNKRTGKHVNLLAYKSNSNYVLTYGMTKDSLIIYVGGEGEWFGKDKLMIPIKELLE